MTGSSSKRTMVAECVVVECVVVVVVVVGCVKRIFRLVFMVAIGYGKYIDSLNVMYVQKGAVWSRF